MRAWRSSILKYPLIAEIEKYVKNTCTHFKRTDKQEWINEEFGKGLKNPIVTRWAFNQPAFSHYCKLRDKVEEILVAESEKEKVLLEK